MKKSVKVIISGGVQGVWFRVNTKQKADELGIFGWARNTDDGCVEAIFEGEEKQIEEIIKWCHRGPSLARVEKVEIKKRSPTNEFNDFSIRY